MSVLPLRLDRITLREIRLSLREPFRISSGEIRERRILLLEFVEAGGARCWSECVAGEAPNYSPETIDTAWLMIEQFAGPRALSAPLGHPGEVNDRLARDFRGHQMARAAVEMGVWGLAATIAGEPLGRFIGGTRREIGVGISLGIQASSDQLVAKARDALAAGYRKIKIKIEPGRDVEWVRAVRRELGPGAPLMADANNAYSISDAGHLAGFDELELAMIEQPLAWDDLVRHAELQRQLRTPVCLDESITSLERAQDMVTLGAGRIINIKPGRVAGLSSAIVIHDFCQQHGVPVWCGGMFESGVGRAYNVALASLPNFTIPGDVSPSARYWKQDIVSPEWTMHGGLMRVPLDQPGLGVAVDADRIASLTVRSSTLTR